jgi:NAD(P)-dependent dehydrogenase (short-subunit alcohol dehydrogenase family)
MLPTAYDITHKVVCITGAGRGIGKGIAQVLAAAGADVGLKARTPRYVEQTAAEIAKDTGRHGGEGWGRDGSLYSRSNCPGWFRTYPGPGVGLL